MRVVFDAWALVALMKEEPAAGRVEALMKQHDAWMSSINLGEAYYSVVRSHGRRAAIEGVQDIRKAVHVEDPDWTLVRDAADIKVRGGLSYPDAFCVATARRQGAPLYTGDPEIIAFDGEDVDVVDLRKAP